jgi:hypothetical protein
MIWGIPPMRTLDISSAPAAIAEQILYDQPDHRAFQRRASARHIGVDRIGLVCTRGEQERTGTHPAPRVQSGRRDQAEVECPQVVFGKFRPRKMPASQNRGAHVLRGGKRFRNS